MVTLASHDFGSSGILQGFRERQRQKGIEQEKIMESLMTLAGQGKLMEGLTNPKFKQFAAANPAKMMAAKATNATKLQSIKNQELVQKESQFAKLSKIYDNNYENLSEPNKRKLAEQLDAVGKQVYNADLGYRNSIDLRETKKNNSSTFIDEALLAIESLNSDTQDKSGLANNIAKKLSYAEKNGGDKNMVEYAKNQFEAKRAAILEQDKAETDRKNKLKSDIEIANATNKVDFTLKNGRTVKVTQNQAKAWEDAGRGTIGKEPSKPNTPDGSSQQRMLNKDVLTVEEKILEDPEDKTAIAKARYFNNNANTPYAYVFRKEDKGGISPFDNKNARVERVDLPKTRDGRQVTMEDVRHTMKKHGWTLEQTLEKLNVL